MGLLDDAIREHLDLKRRRGADPADVERDERDALGPVRRAPEGAAEEPEPSPGLDTEQELAYDQADEPGWEDAPPSEGIVFEAELESGEGEPAERSVADDAVTADDSREESVFEGRDPAFDLVDPEEGSAPAPERVDPESDTDPAPERAEPVPDEPRTASREQSASEQEAPDEPGRSVADTVGGETVEYDVERALGNEDGEEDVLEETPEFLQDTPDHDRLWFEQRPPRDFDFDG
jgi:hypothetical protein